MRIASFNVNSVRARLPALLDWLAAHQPDILCLQETKVQDQDFPVKAFAEAGYSACYKGQKSYNGVALLGRPAWAEVRTELSGEPGEQARFLDAHREDGLEVINVYVPQGFDPQSDKFTYKLKWLDDLLAYLQRHCDPRMPLVVAGDFNVALEPGDVYDPGHLAGSVGFHPEEQRRLRALLEWGLVDLLRRFHPEPGLYTFWDYRIPNGFKRNLGWRIDYILTTTPMAAKAADVWIDKEIRAAAKPSDHTPIVADFLD